MLAGTRPTLRDPHFRAILVSLAGQSIVWERNAGDARETVKYGTQP